MKGRSIILDHLEGREAAALIIDGHLEDLFIDSDAPTPGTVYRAIADRPVKGQGGMFMRTPDGTGFLRQVRGISPGQALLVQVTGHAEPGKAIPLTDRLLFKSRHAIITPDKPGLNVSRTIRDEARRDALLEIAHEAMDGRDRRLGLILRSSCASAEDAEIAEDIAAMADLASAVLEDADGEPEALVAGDAPHARAWREWVEPAEVDARGGGFERHDVIEMVEALRSARAALPGGASIFVEPTRALVAVDVNTGGDASPAAGLKANLAAARDLPRQLRLRGLGGQITIDFAPMPKKDRRAIESALRAAFRADSTETALVGWTPLGHYELQRKRDRQPLAEVLS